MATDFDAARISLRRIPVARFNPWRLRRPEAAAIREADNDVQNGWVREADREIVELVAPYGWEAEGAPAISVTQMQSWDMLDALLVAHAATGSWAYLEVAVELAEDWADHGAQAGGSWTTRPLASRAHRLAYLVHAAATEDAVDMSRWRTLARLAERHGKRLAADDAQAIDGLLVALARRSLAVRLGDHLAIRPPLDGAIRTGLVGAVDARGTVASPSTADHLTVAAALAALEADDESLVLADERRRIEDGLAWLITTDGYPANFGTTALEPVNGLWRGGDVAVHELIAPLASDLLAHTLSAGTEGQSPTADTAILRGADLMVAKPVWTSYGQSGGYVAVHRTSGSLVWHDAGRALLIAPGTNTDALRGGKAGRISRAVAWLDSTTPNGLSTTPVSISRNASARVGVLNEAIFFDVTRDTDDGALRRSIVLDPGHWLFVADWISGDGPPMEAEQSFLLGPGLDAMQHEGSFVIATDGTPLAWASSVHGGAVPIGPQRGDVDGDDGGWWAPRPGRVAPATQIGWAAHGSHLLMAVVFSLVGPVHQAPADAWSFAFTVEDHTTRLTLGAHGLVDLQETS